MTNVEWGVGRSRLPAQVAESGEDCEEDKGDGAQREAPSLRVAVHAVRSEVAEHAIVELARDSTQRVAERQRVERTALGNYRVIDRCAIVREPEDDPNQAGHEEGDQQGHGAAAALDQPRDKDNEAEQRTFEPHRHREPGDDGRGREPFFGQRPQRPDQKRDKDG